MTVYLSDHPCKVKEKDVKFLQGLVKVMVNFQLFPTEYIASTYTEKYIIKHIPYVLCITWGKGVKCSHPPNSVQDLDCSMPFLTTE